MIVSLLCNRKLILFFYFGKEKWGLVLCIKYIEYIVLLSMYNILNTNYLSTVENSCIDRYEVSSK